MTSNNILKNSLLLIPDISGFTKFVNQTETIHGSHIIAELLEIIIETNTIGLKVAEIEGDAILFYRNGKKPTLKEVYDQCKQMFIAFHEHIRLYNRDRICDCGACSNTSELTLKFIVHYGEIMERNISGHFQLMGADVTTAHKLMKNNIELHEYLLISEDSVTKSSNTMPKWFDLISSKMRYENIGDVNYNYVYLKPLLNELSQPKKREDLATSENPILFQIFIDADKKDVHKLFISLERKHEWVEGLKKVIYDSDKVNRIGTKHECILPLNSLHIETVKNDISDEKIVYAETTEKTGFTPAYTQITSFEEITTNRCKISSEIHYEKSFLSDLIFRKLVKKSIDKSLINLKTICEQESKH